jgi:hypothetical protein
MTAPVRMTASVGRRVAIARPVAVAVATAVPVADVADRVVHSHLHLYEHSTLPRRHELGQRALLGAPELVLAAPELLHRVEAPAELLVGRVRVSDRLLETLALRRQFPLERVPRLRAPLQELAEPLGLPLLQVEPAPGHVQEALVESPLQRSALLRRLLRALRAGLGRQAP